MQCPICHHQETKVIDSRLLQEGTSIRRRRRCLDCDHRFTTYEKIMMQMPMIVKNDGRREDYSRDKLLSGINKACQKRPVAMHQIEQLAETIEKKLVEQSQSEIDSQILGEIAMKHLHDLDPVAFVRFASFYWDFKDIKGFIKGLKKNVDSFKIDLPEQMM
ncbi:MAG: transcriptional regulator NrdR [Bacteriovoracaceae bacterium]